MKMLNLLIYVKRLTVQSYSVAWFLHIFFQIRKLLIKDSNYERLVRSMFF